MSLPKHLIKKSSKALKYPSDFLSPVKIKGKNENGEIKDYYLYLLLDVDDCIRIGRPTADIKEELKHYIDVLCM